MPAARAYFPGQGGSPPNGKSSLMTDHRQAHADTAARALQLLEEAWAYFESAPRPVAPAVPSGYDLPDAA